ncbi:hypothetical protein B0J13DRAFT_632691 [Dactylonectria estremocensis]|uniref:Uncharacterized protein n=1 Tax=Dactylonectria estremocensis TaxID=1079267 RepID=A0A9P9FI73_9HYPO|nr:hypothetical protein B0J13DRAFT_632691 [Dactylonectria estremocensis]
MSSIISRQHPELVPKGRGLHAQMLREIHRRGYMVRHLPLIAPHYTITLDPPTEAAINSGQQQALADAGLPTSDYVYAEARNPGSGQQAMYQNCVHSQGQVIQCMNNYADRDRFYREPEQIYWTDLMAVAFHRVTAAYGGDAKGLQAIWRLNIENNTTKRIIETICGPHPMIPVDLQAGDDGFFALLGSDHGKGPARMLAAYPEMFGCRIIASVPVFPWGSLPSLY